MTGSIQSCITRHSLPRATTQSPKAGPPVHPFWYANHRTGKRIRDRNVLQYIRSVQIPSTYKDVCINPDKDASLLATGRDTKGNLQYRYNPSTIRSNSRDKFRRMVGLSELLPTIRASLDAGGKSKLTSGMDSKEEAVKMAISLLSQCSFRIGNPKYLKQNQSHGLTNLLVRHYDPKHHIITFKGKTNQTNVCKVQNEATQKYLQRRARSLKPSDRIFSYTSRRNEGQRSSILPVDINQVLRSHGDITAKDFRMWTANASLLGALSAHYNNNNNNNNKRNKKKNAKQTRTIFEKRRIMKQSIERVATLLNHSPSVCKTNYIHPGIYDMYMSDDSEWLERMLKKISRSHSDRKCDELLKRILTHLDDEKW